MSTFTELTDLAAERLGGVALGANDEFFAEKENLLKASKPIFIEDKYTDRGKWMDGWETRRRREPGHDWCLVRLGLPGIIRGVDIDTSFFRGNYPEQASVDACSAPADATAADLLAESTVWTPILARSPLKGDSQNLFPVECGSRFTHVRLNIFPDGGVARFRVHGDVVPDRPQDSGTDEIVDLVSVENGGLIIGCSDMFFSNRNNLTLPGPGRNMGDGWETKRRRGPGHDWVIARLGTEGTLRRIVVDTTHFKGNAPGSCSLEGLAAEAATLEDLVAGEYSWIPILPLTPLKPHTVHTFESEIQDAGPVTHVRLNIFPDGGVMRLRLFGLRSRRGRLKQVFRWLNTMPEAEAERQFRACCGHEKWARRMAEGRPHADLDAVKAAADAAFHELGPEDWRAAFGSHPKIGATGPISDWSRAEQSGAGAAPGETRAELARLNEAYLEKFGFIYIVCASGLSGDEMVANLKSRLQNDPKTEMGIAEQELIRITHLRLEKLLNS